jgi:gluconokinase
MIIVVMGVSGCGKSTIASHIAELLGAHFKDADELHPEKNIQLMSNGTPLTDADRLPWLQDVRAYAAKQQDSHDICVIACSALKQSYRELLRQAPNVHFVFLKGDKQMISQRMHLRSGHFMHESMLDSQFEALESPENEPLVVTVDITPAPDVIAKNAVTAMRDASYL